MSWITYFLQNRSQRVVLNGISSELRPVEAGVIQGSILGPILFLIFIMDINEVIPTAIIIQKYADEILTYILNSTEAHCTLPQEIVNAIEKWSINNKMRLNFNKSKVMSLANGQNTEQQIPTILGGQILEPVHY